MRLAPPTPELPVPDVRAAQEYYRDVMGFEIAWYNAAGGLGAVNHGDCALFFRTTKGPVTPATFWIFAHDVDAAFADLTSRGANITDPICNTEWGMRQFTVVDTYGNTFIFHHDF